MRRFLANIDRTFWPALALLLCVLVVFEVTELDLRVQDLFFDFESSRWLIDRKAALPRALFYSGPKFVIIGIGILLLVLTVGPGRWRERWNLHRRGLIVALLTLAVAPSIIAVAKATTNVFCPYQIERYGGDQFYVPTCTCYPEEHRPERRGRCFPAGHASGGFALWGLIGLARSSASRRRFFYLGATVGGVMGLYQMMKGAHYLSHTLITVCIVWIVFLLARRVMRCRESVVEEVAPIRG